jgi:hypothetical protein
MFAVPFAVLSFASLASFEAALASASLWSAGPGGVRVSLPFALLDGVARVLLSDVVGESPFQSWGASFELRLFVGALPVAGAVLPYPLFLADPGFVQLAAGAAPGRGCSESGVFVFDVLCSVAV